MRALRILVASLMLLVTSFALAHEMSMAEMELREASPGEFLWQWTASGSRPANSELTPLWPTGCTSDANVLRCGEAGLRGTLRVDGVGERYSAAMVKVFWLDGQSRVFTLTAASRTDLSTDSSKINFPFALASTHFSRISCSATFLITRSRPVSEACICGFCAR